MERRKLELTIALGNLIQSSEPPDEDSDESVIFILDPAEGEAVKRARKRERDRERRKRQAVTKGLVQNDKRFPQLHQGTSKMETKRFPLKQAQVGIVGLLEIALLK